MATIFDLIDWDFGYRHLLDTINWTEADAEREIAHEYAALNPQVWRSLTARQRFDFVNDLLRRRGRDVTKDNPDVAVLKAVAAAPRPLKAREIVDALNDGFIEPVWKLDGTFKALLARMVRVNLLTRPGRGRNAQGYGITVKGRETLRTQMV